MSTQPRTTDATGPGPTAATPAADAVVVRLPGPLRSLAGGRDEVELTAHTVHDALDDLVDRYPALRRHLLTDAGEVRDYVNLFVGDEDVRYLDGPGTGLEPGQVLTIVPSIAGG